MIWENISYYELLTQFVQTAGAGWCFGAVTLWLKRFLESSIST
jgi:hypothetical protein